MIQRAKRLSGFSARLRRFNPEDSSKPRSAVVDHQVIRSCKETADLSQLLK